MADAIIQTLGTDNNMLTVKSFKRNKIRKERLTRDEYELLCDINTTLETIRSLEQCFQFSSDPSVISSCIYSIKAEKERYSFLLKRAQEMNLRYSSYVKYSRAF